MAMGTRTVLFTGRLFARTPASGDAATAIPLGLAFFFRSVRGERFGGLAVVFAIFASACVALVQTVERFIHPSALSHLWWLAAAGVIGFLGTRRRHGSAPAPASA
jgi:hypothetical protein